MLGATSGRLEWILAVLACVACAVFALMGAAQSTPALKRTAALAATPPVATVAPQPVAAPPAPVARKVVRPTRGKVAIDLGRIGAGTTLRRTPVRAQPSSATPTLSVIGRGITLPIDGSKGNWVHVMTPCEVGGWVRTGDLTLHPIGGPTAAMHDAVFVIDPGHGGSESGAIGPDGVQEKDVNLAIARQLVAQLKGSRVFMTRTGNYNVGLRYRALLASRLHATALLSMHNNSGPTVPDTRPGTQTWHQVHSMASSKLAAILWQNLSHTLSRYHGIRWVSMAHKIGPLTRANTKGADYYAVLRQSTVPAVIVESLFINNRTEERLLQHADVQKAIAAAAAQSVRTFVNAGGALHVAPYKVKPDRTGGLRPGCVDPS